MELFTDLELFSLFKGMTVKNLIDKAEGLKTDVFLKKLM